MTEESLTDARINAWRPRLVECPKCNAQLLFGGKRVACANRNAQTCGVGSIMVFKASFVSFTTSSRS